MAKVWALSTVWAIVCLGVILLVSGPLAGESPYQVAWVRQIGTGSDDKSYSVAVDASGNAYVSGYTEGSLGGPTTWNEDAFLAKYDAQGHLIWSRQIGTEFEEISRSVAVDASGNAYISGETFGSIGGTNAGSNDAFLTKYDASGNVLWSRQVGTTSNDYSRSVTIDASGNAYISGYTFGNLAGPMAGVCDAFLTKYDASGNLLWSRQIGTAGYEYSYSVATDGSGNAYIAGKTSGGLGGPNQDCSFLAKYDASGNVLWLRQIGTYASDDCRSVAVDASGNAYVSGSTLVSLGGLPILRRRR